ncbi:MAG TPA: hypothetical protein VMH33_03205 [Solirubrobacterales bacterium]|nr:hypothetical protein [Solirubrobacterales bacterium]
MNSRPIWPSVRIAIAIFAAILLFGALGASPATAAFAGVGHFSGSEAHVAEEAFGEEVQLGGLGGMAVNYTGAGGVPVGTVYTATAILGETRIAMFEPKEGGLEFVEAWEAAFEEGPYERCGPLLGTEVKDGKEVAEFPCKARAKTVSGTNVDIDVDEASGDVFAMLEVGSLPVGTPAIVEYAPDGSSEITRFGEKAPGGQAVAESPAKIHISNYPGGIAVTPGGSVYVFDEDGGSDNFFHRLMEFRPNGVGGYEYAGREHDVGTGFFGEGNLPTAPIADAAGNLYVGGSTGGEHIEEYDPAHPADPPVCKFEYPKGGIKGVTVDPQTGEPFFASSKRETGFTLKVVHQLGPCEGGEFKEKPSGIFEVKPERDDLAALAFDPMRKFSLSRPAGILYGGAPGPTPAVGKGEPGQSALGYIFAPAEEHPPSVSAQSVSRVTQDSAELQAGIDPNGFRTRYAFQYLTAAAYEEAGDSFAAAAEGPPGEPTLQGVGAKSAATTVTGLLPDTEYVFRTVAESACAEAGPPCGADGPPFFFRTFSDQVGGLPDSRAYELVSPREKYGGQVFPADAAVNSCVLIECKPAHAGHQSFPLQSTADGEAISYEGTAFSPEGGATVENQYLAHRTADGWQSANSTPSLLQVGSGYDAFDSSLELGVLSQAAPVLSPSAPDGFPDLYTQDTSDPLQLTPLVTEAPPNRVSGNGTGHFEIHFAGASSDLSRIFFEANDALTEETEFAPRPPDPGATKFDLYEWSEGQLSLVNVAPGNAEVKAGSLFGAAGAHAISANGRRVFFSDEAGQTYVREDGKVTRAIATAGVPDPGKFLAADADGSKVLLQNGHLHYLDGEEATVDLTEGEGGFDGILGQSEALSRIYFVDSKVLPSALGEENKGGEEAEAGKPNLYAWAEGTGTEEAGTVYIATLSTQDNSAASGDWQVVPSVRTAEASPDGRYVTFLSQASLSGPTQGYSNVGPCSHNGDGEVLVVPCQQAYVYDSASGRLACASCDPSGAAPLGPSALRLLEGAPRSMPQARYLTDEGRLYFDSQDSLSPRDTNEGIEDVYQWEPPAGIGEPAGDSCDLPEGCVALISAGREGGDSNLLAVDETGKNIFFTTRDRLVAGDTDQLIDLYDAREGGGFPGESVLPARPCQGEACQALTPPPEEPTPATLSFTGPGNVIEQAQAYCKQGKVKKKGRCVKKQQKKGKRKKKGKARRGRWQGGSR